MERGEAKLEGTDIVEWYADASGLSELQRLQTEFEETETLRDLNNIEKRLELVPERATTKTGIKELTQRIEYGRQIMEELEAQTKTERLTPRERETYYTLLEQRLAGYLEGLPEELKRQELRRLIE